MHRFLLPVLLFACLSCIARENVRIATEPSWLFSTNPDLSKKPDVRKVSSGYYLDLYNRQINITEQSIYTKFIRTIVNETGIQEASEISVVFAPEYQDVQFHYVRVIRDGKQIDQLSKSAIKVVQEETDVDEYQYNGLHRAFIILKDIRRNDKIEVAYSVKGFNPVYNNKFTTSIYFSNGNPISNYYETIIVDASKNLRFKYFRNAPQPSESQNGTSKIYHWNNPSIALWESASSIPSWYEMYPSVTVSEFGSWKEVADWALSNFNGYQFTMPAGLLAQIEQWKKSANGDNDEFIRLALRYVQDNIRYLGLEIGINTHKPHSPAEVFHNGFGDCKDKALLLSVILQSQNIPAYTALVNTSAKTALINSAPTPNEFDHAIVGIERQGSYKFVDPTQSYQRGEVNDIYISDYGYALLLKAGEADLRTVDPTQNNVVRVFERLKVSMKDTSYLTVNSTYRGGKADNIRSYFSGNSSDDIRDVYEKYYASMYDDARLTEDVSYEDDSVYNVLKVTEKYAIPAIWSTEDSPKLAFTTSAKLISQYFSDPAGHNVKHPFAFSYPVEIHYALDLEMPEEWSFPKDKLHVKNGSYEFDFDVEKNGSLITLKYSLVTFRDHIPAAEVAQYKADYKKITDVLYYELSYDKSVAGNTSPNGDGINWLVIAYCIMLSALIFGVFLYLNSRSVYVQYDRSSGWPIGGWMVVLGLSIVAGIGMNAYNLIAGEYYSTASYLAWKSYGTLFLLTALAELSFSVIWLLFSIAVFVWYIKRRDIFPTMFTAYVATLVLSQVALLSLYSFFSDLPEFSGTVSTTTTSIVRSLIYGGIWCTYVLRSDRAKATFLKS